MGVVRLSDRHLRDPRPLARARRRVPRGVRDQQGLAAAPGSAGLTLGVGIWGRMCCHGRRGFRRRPEATGYLKANSITMRVSRSSEKTARDDRFGVERVDLLPAAQVLIGPHPGRTEVDDHLVVSVVVQIAGRDAFGRQGVQLRTRSCRSAGPTRRMRRRNRSPGPPRRCRPGRPPPAA